MQAMLQRRWLTACLIAAVGCALPAAYASDYATADAVDRDALERALFLCGWRTHHAIPDNAPTPAVCTATSVSIDDALLQSKQWWMYWARFDNTGVTKANTQFGEDYLAFQARQRQKRELADELLPPGVRLPPDDWRVLLVQDLKIRALKDRSATAGP